MDIEKDLRENALVRRASFWAGPLHDSIDTDDPAVFSVLWTAQEWSGRPGLTGRAHAGVFLRVGQRGSDNVETLN